MTVSPRLIWLLVVACLLWSYSASSAAIFAPRVPVGKWVVDFADAQCVASRNYGTVAEPLWLVMKTPPVDNVIQLALIQTGSAPTEQLDGQIAANGGRPINASFVSFTNSKTKQRVYTTNLLMTDFAVIRSATTVSFNVGPIREQFTLSSIEPVLKIMETCVADLREVWNAGEPGRPSLKIRDRAGGTLQGILKPEDYPGDAIFRLQGGTVVFAVLIDETGAVADCSVIETSRVAALDTQSCAIIKKRAKFQPARGADGKPLKSTFMQRVTWRVQ